VQLGHFKGSNTTYEDANPTPRIIFNYGETIPSGTLWLDVRARILDRAAMNYENLQPTANLGFNFQFQPEYRDGSGNVVLEDYDNPDFWAGGRVFPKVVNFDIFLSSHLWWPLGIDREERAVGSESRHINSASDADLHVQRVEGQMLSTNTWYSFHIDLGYDINRALQMTEDHYYSITGDYFSGWYTLNRLILRNIQLYTEASGALIEAEIDKAFIYTTNDAGTGGDAGDDFNSATLISPGTYTGELHQPGDTEDWYRFYATRGDDISVYMTPPPEVDFDLQLYDPSAILKDGSYAGAGYMDSVSFSAGSSGYWRIRIYIYSGAGQYSFDVRVSTPSGGHGGCPYVSTWNGNGYVLENNVLLASEYSGGTDVSDYYILQHALMQREDETYSLLLSEFENEQSFFDNAELLAVDHSSITNVAVSPYGEIFTYTTPQSPVSAIDSDNRNVKSLLSSIDENYYEGHNGSYITLNFGDEVNISKGAKLVLRSDWKGKKSLLVQVQDAQNNWNTVVIVSPRTYWSTDIIDMSKHLPDAKGNFKVRLYFTASHKLDYVGLDTSPQETMQVKQGQLVNAVHSVDGNVINKLLYRDQVYTELWPGQSIELAFTLPQQTMEKRNYIIKLEGHYYTLI
jgi:hypothetical protein